MIILSAIWGSAFIAIKISVEVIHPVSVASFRLIIGSIFLFLFFLVKKYEFNISRKNILYIILIGIIGNLIPFSLISWSEQYIQSNTAGLLLSVAPIFTLILSHFLTKDDKFTFLKFISIIIGLLGVLFILGFDSLINLSLNGSNNLLPKLAIIISALGYVISAILAYNLNKINTITLTTFVTIASAVISIPFMIYCEIHFPSDFTNISLFSLLYLGLFPTAIAFHLRFHLILKAGPIFLSYVAYLIPVFAIFWGYVFLKETINFSIFIGVILILIGVFLGQKETSKKLVSQVTQKRIND